MALAPGDRIGPYEIRALLGAGGMGEVYRGRDTRLGRDVALLSLYDHRIAWTVHAIGAMMMVAGLVWGAVLVARNRA